MADTPRLVDRVGRPIERRRLTEEIAGPTLTGVRQVMTGYPGDGLDPRRLATILREADEGEPLRYFELAETIEERDLHYAGVLGTRKRSVAQLDVQVDSASDEAADVDRADMVREWLGRDELQDEMFDMLDCIGKGISITEIVWETSAGQWRPARLEWRDPRWFRFDRADGRTPLVRELGGDEPLAPFKFITAVIRAKSGLPVRSGIARLACWAWMFKAFTQRDWAIFTQTFGQPIRVGRYGPGATEDDKDTLFRAVANIAGDCAAIVPESMLIEFIQAEAKGESSKLYLERSDWLDRQVSKAVLGQTATTDAIAGGHAVGREHRQVQEDIERADARTLSAILNRDLVRPWIDLEHGPQKLYPKLRIGRADERDLAMVLEQTRHFISMGLRVEESQVRDALGWAEPEDDAVLLTAPAVPTAAPAPRVAGDDEDDDAGTSAHARRQQLPDDDELAAGAAVLSQPPTAALLEMVRTIVADAGTLAEAQARIADLRLSPADLAMAMRQALILAELTGRMEVAADG